MKTSPEAHCCTKLWRQQDSHAAQADFLPPSDYKPGPSRLKGTYTPTTEDLAQPAVNCRRRTQQIKKKKKWHQSHHTTDTQTRSDLHAPTFSQEMRELEYRKARAKHRRREDSELDEVGKDDRRGDWDPKIEAEPSCDQYRLTVKSDVDTDDSTDWVDKWDHLGQWKGQSLEAEGLVDPSQAAPQLGRDPGWDKFEGAE
ncbi:hypothetical protein HK097_001623 [Rhizophlyctis rosea]|uniref:Uncharacterized protein n=1 Tax=Rhizophlyctis rosea TaxID=64517 RepID=A0AAD5S477_9FUNG|nr:hypothetical protein HK097_001623 [Rhizophlyctis rosea]